MSTFGLWSKTAAGSTTSSSPASSAMTTHWPLPTTIAWVWVANAELAATRKRLPAIAAALNVLFRLIEPPWLATTHEQDMAGGPRDACEPDTLDRASKAMSKRPRPVPGTVTEARRMCHRSVTQRREWLEQA